ncbi:MFS transporter [Paraburkholderia silvatlantica]|uniref:MFS transporter n=1 Tax=Paraburkholderia silvatlantica TaxID=321895 RepID=A0A2U1AHW0_9BURK|nr:MFS transporter [Paraburkholderia silvatlantica]MBB2929309.1 putative MFS transporter [Paraburkholderia silvatlantica]PVY35999.1 putative MFS transporter [Paraburkholderia silvatlantica]PXW39947.1 putative MFS transporter [Paraburkholderia silvatlantica]PYE19705.1 putative MFS transporter [Paraburkholderia silvatlantica]
MSSLPIGAMRASLRDHADVPASAAEINARIDRLPATRTIWTLVLLLSLGGWFEFYDLFFTAYVGPGLVKSGLYSTTTASFFGFSGLGAFVAASFAGLFIGTFCLTGLADRYGRRTLFTASLLWYSVATCIMALQTSAPGINLWRLIAGIGVGVELVTIDTYVSELVPKHMRGRAFAFVHLVQYTAVPAVALLAWWFVPRAPLGFDGWRWVVMFGAFGALIAWAIRRRVPESARWLAQRGRTEEAARILARLEAKIEAQHGRSLPAPVVESASAQTHAKTRFAEIWQPPYRRRTCTLLVFNLFQAIGFYGFASWVPTLLVSKGITVTHSLLYSFVIAASNPFGPLLGMAIADRIERKTLVVLSALAIAVCGTLFAMQTSAGMLMFLGVLITLGGTLLSVGYHAYQVELFPTRMRATAVGFVYSMSRLSAMFSGFMIAFALRHFGVPGVFALITGAMIVVMAAIGIFGPRTKNRALDDISR